MGHLAQAIIEWDRTTFLALNHGLKCGFLDGVMPRVTDIGLGYVQAPIVVVLAVWLGARAGEVRCWRDVGRAIYRRRVWVGPLLVCFVLSGLSALAFKRIPRERPWWFYLNERQAGRHQDVTVYTVAGVYPLKVYGFPSGHTATTVAMATVVTLLAGGRGRGWLLLGAWSLAGLVGFSRLYLASHWPLDVLGGTALGVASGFAAVRLCRWWAGRKHLAAAPTS